MQEKKGTAVKEEKKEEVTLEKILSMAIPPALKERLKQLREEHEENYRLHEDKVAVCNVSTASLSEIDGIPGWYDVNTMPAEFTKQGLLIVDRYEVKINMVPTGDRVYNYGIVDRTEWEKGTAAETGLGLSTEQIVAANMLRQGGDA